MPFFLFYNIKYQEKRYGDRKNIADIFGFGGEKTGLACYIILIEYWIELNNQINQE